MKHIKPEELKAFLLGLGLSAFFMAASLVTSTVRQSTANQHGTVLQKAGVKHKVEHYSEIIGMN